MYAGMMKMKKSFWKKRERKITKPSLTPLICSEQRSSGDKLTLLALSLVSRSPPQPPWLVAINSQSSRGNSRRAALFYRVVKGNLGRDASWVINISPWPRLTLKVCMLSFLDASSWWWWKFVSLVLFFLSSFKLFKTSFFLWRGFLFLQFGHRNCTGWVGAHNNCR